MPSRDKMVKELLDNVYNWEPWELEEFVIKKLTEHYANASDADVEDEYRDKIDDEWERRWEK